MAQQIINNGEQFLTVRTKINSNFSELYSDDNRAYASISLAVSGTSQVPEVLSITAGTPVSPTSLTTARSLGFTYIGGQLRYDGTKPVIVKVDGAVSMTSSINNVTATSFFAKDGLITDSDAIRSKIRRKIQTGADVGAIPVAGTFYLENGDFLNFYVDTDTNSTITLTEANFTIHVLSIIY